jgi:hypothetical protein
LTLFQNDPAKVILWLMLCQQWPHATARMLDWLHDHRVRDVVNMGYVYSQIAVILDDKTTGKRHAQLDYDNHPLDVLMEKYGGYLTNKDVEVLQGLTLNFHPTLAREMREFFE